MPFANTNKEVRNFTLLYKATPANVVQLFTKTIAINLRSI